MNDALHGLTLLDPLAMANLPALLTLSFVAFNTMRIALHVPQLLTCLRDENGCSAINLWTWCSWIAASLSNGLYMGLLLQDRWGLLLNAANALMCAATVVVTCVKRQRFAARRTSRREPTTRSAPLVEPQARPR